MAHSIWLPADRFQDAKRNDNVHGMQTTVALSAYDTPRRVLSEYDQASGEFVIKFDYIDDEPSAAKVKSIENVKFVEGKFSGKLLSIRVPTDESGLDKTRVIQLQSRLLQALDIRGESFGEKLDLQLNQEAAREVIENDLDELVGV